MTNYMDEPLNIEVTDTALQVNHDTTMIMMMWFDSSPKSTLEQKIDKAAEYYLNKFKTSARFCVVSRGAIHEPYVYKGIEIVDNKYVIPNTFLIGRNNVFRQSE